MTRCTSSTFGTFLSAAVVFLLGACSSPVITSLDVQLLQPDPGEAASYASAGVRLVTLELGWDAYEPSAGEFDRDYVDRRAEEAHIYAQAGLDVVLDLGLQYPPAWAWDLPGETRFINQYGDQWRGEVGTDPLDGVWNAAVRDAQKTYVAQVALDFADVVDRVRVGGLLSGEIRLPPARTGDRVDSLWSFGENALAASPDPSWRPGTGVVADSREWLDFYLSSVTEYAVWLARTVDTSFGGMPIDVLFPGWGIRPGMLDSVADGLVSTEAVSATGDDLAGGLDWSRQLRALARLNLDMTAVSTWLDAPEYGTSTRDIAPAEYLSRLTHARGIPLAGENTGGNGSVALQRIREQAERLSLKRVVWMPDHTPGDITPQQLGAAFAH